MLSLHFDEVGRLLCLCRFSVISFAIVQDPFSNPQSQEASGRRPTPWTARPLGPAHHTMYVILSCSSTHTVKDTTSKQGTPNTTRQTSLIFCQISISQSNHLYVSCENHAGAHNNTQLAYPDPNTNLK